MSLVVEDGTFKADAEAYCDVAFFRDYHNKRGNTLAAAIETDTRVEELLRVSFEFMMTELEDDLEGCRTTATQRGDFPREWLPMRDVAVTTYYANNAIPLEVKQANAELALTAYFQELSPNVDRETIREKVDVIEVEYAANSSPVTIFRTAMARLAKFRRMGSSFQRRVIRT